MSADKWTACPACRSSKQESFSNRQRELSETYGAIPMEEWIARRDQLNLELEDYDDSGDEDSRESTFREDYEIYGAKEGTVMVRYSGYCNKCNQGFSFTIDFPFWPEIGTPEVNARKQ